MNTIGSPLVRDWLTSEIVILLMVVASVKKSRPASDGAPLGDGTAECRVIT